MEEQPRQYNQNLLFSFSAGNQSRSPTISVPFRVKRIVFHPPRSNLLVDAADSYILSNGLTNGICGVIEGSVTRAQAGFPVTVQLENPITVQGVHRFQVRSFTEASGGAASDLTALVYQLVEFHSV